jgi:hypothetical protein
LKDRIIVRVGGNFVHGRHLPQKLRHKYLLGAHNRCEPRHRLGAFSPLRMSARMALALSAIGLKQTFGGLQRRHCFSSLRLAWVGLVLIAADATEREQRKW